MASKITEFRDGAIDLAKRPRTRKIAIWVVSIVVAIGVIGALIAPPLVRQKLASELSKTLHREVSIQQIRINPYAMSVTVRGFLMKERQGPATALSFDELYANLELQSLFRWGPVFKEVRLVKPYVNLVRNEDRTYNFTDLIDEFTKGPAGPTPRFSLNNIEVIDGRINFDDRPEGVKHAVTSIRIGVPFISSLPSYTDIKVQPAFSAVIDGAPVEIRGETEPFSDSLESTFHLDIDRLQIPKYFEYSPVELKFKVPSGQLDGELTASFRTAKGKPSILKISGHVELKDLVMQGKDDAPILSLPGFEVVVDAVEVFARRAGIKSVKLQSPELHLTRNRDGTMNLGTLVAANANPAGEKVGEQKEPASPFAYRCDEVLLDQGKLVFDDRSLEHPFQKRLENIHVLVKGLSNEPGQKAETEISFQTDAKEQFNHSGTVQLTPLLVDGKFELKGLQLKPLLPYYESVVALEVREGQLDLSAHPILEQKGEILDTKLTEVNAALRSLRLHVSGESEPLWRVPLLSVKDTTVDIGKKAVTIGAVEARDGNGFVKREADGTFSYARLIKARASEGQSTPPAKKDDTEWKFSTKRIALDRFGIVFEDQSLPTPAKMVVSEFSVRGENFSNAANTRAKTTLQAKINNKGALKMVGSLGRGPVAGQFEVEARDIDLLPFQPYWTDRVNFLLTGGEIGTKGSLAFETGGNGPAKVSYEGNLQVNDFGSIEKSSAEDLLKWKSLALNGIQFSMQPVQLDINEIALGDFYSRVIIGSDGKINLQNVMAQKKEETAAKDSASSPAPQAAGTAEAAQPRITIGKVNLQGGNVDFSDFFVKPNYSANLTGVQGFVSALKQETPADVHLQAKIDNAAPVDINGKINPLAKDLFLDIKANARDIDLSPLTPYSAKYVGYGIEKGKLSLDIQYKLENRKLSAQNKIILNQLTFGDRIESPTATKLPVLLAVALLKDRNGVIDVDLPISGSLDDPQFSVGGIVLRIILNIITKAVTSPFALLGAAFGGGGEELSYVEFDYGRAKISPAAEERLKTLATALTNRPALRLEIAGRVDPVNDLEGLKRLAVERKVKAQKMKDLAGQAAAPKSVDDVQISSEEYPRFLWAAYKQEDFPKERNVIGLVKELPVPQMEKLMLEHVKISDADLSELASHRAQAVRDYLLDNSKVGADRLFLVASKPPSAEEKGKVKAKESRVDFSLR
jgi:Domain of Unknown Function (DUF748)